MPLTQGAAVDFWPAWSLDGLLAFYSNRTGNPDILVVPAEGGEVRQITTASSIEVGPEWSPDGKWLAFTSDREDGVWRVWRVPALGGPPQPVTEGHARGFRWSPDEKHITSRALVTFGP